MNIIIPHKPCINLRFHWFVHTSGDLSSRISNVRTCGVVIFLPLLKVIYVHHSTFKVLPCHDHGVQPLYRRMGYVKRTGTTTRPPVPQGLYDECRRVFLGDIDKKMKQYKIPPELVLFTVATRVNMCKHV